jgi:hypothetical protein
LISIGSGSYSRTGDEVAMGRLKISLRNILSGTVLYNYLFIAFLLLYNYLLRDMILTASMGAVYEVRKAPAFGIIIMVVIVLGTCALMMKCRELRASELKPEAGIGYVLCVLNWVVVISMAFTAVQSFGIKVTENTDKLSGLENAAIMMAIFSALIQGGFAFAFLVRLSEPYEKPIGMGKRAAAALAAFAYACIAYTVVWETIESNSMSTIGAFDLTTGEGISNLIGWFFCFILLYPPMRIPFILQEAHDIKNGGTGVWIGISYIVVLLAALVPIVKNPFL